MKQAIFQSFLSGKTALFCLQMRMGRVKTALEKTIVRSNRIVWLDYLRAVGIIFVMWYHLIYDINAFYGVCDFIYSDWMDVFRDVMVSMLVLISGVCCHFSRSNIKRGAICFGFAMLLTLVTYIMDQRLYIRFGVLHMFGISMMAYGLLSPLFRFKRKWIAAILMIIGFLCTFMLSNEALGIYRLPLITLPHTLYQSPNLFWLGFPDLAFCSADYYPLLPWMLLFFAGGFLGEYVKKYLKCENMPNIRAFSFIGRHTMILYLVHQPIYYAIFFLLSLLPG